MEYKYDIENNDFYKMVMTDHELSEEEKSIIKKAACQEEVAGRHLGQENILYKYEAVQINGVQTAFPNRLVWDDLHDYCDQNTAVVAPTSKFNDEVSTMMKETEISEQ